MTVHEKAPRRFPDGGAEGATNNFAQRLGAVDDEQPADLGIKPALDQVID